MSNQLVITSGAKVRSLNGVITGTTGVLDSLPINAANGIPQLDSSGKILVSQLPNSVMEYKGTWNAATNTPTLADGTGNQGDVYLCNVAGTVNFGSGPIAFVVGDQVIYSGTIWQRASGSTGTVTSVAVTESGDALSITGSPITTSGTINIGFAGTSAQYVAGDGSLVTFPSIITEAQNLITEVYNETGTTLTKGTVVYINGGHGNLPTITKAIATSDATSAQTYGIVRSDITNNNNGYVVVVGRLTNIDTQAYSAGAQLYLSSTTAGAWTTTKQYAPAHLVYVGIVVRSHPTQGVVEVKIQNGYELDELHNVSAQTPSNNDGIFYNSSNSLWEAKSIATALGYTPVPTTRTLTINGTTYDLSANRSWTINSMVYPGAGIAVSTGTAWGTSITDNSSNWNTAYSLRITSATSPLSITSNVLSISQASGSQSGYLSSTDWTTFNNKQNALTNPVTGTSVTSRIAYFNGTSSITGSSNLNFDGTNLTIGNPSSALAQLHVYNASAAATILLQTNSTTDYSEIAVRNDSSTATSYFRQYSTATTGSDFGISRAGLALFFSNYATNFAIGTRNGGNLILGTNDTERVRILSSNGYVGINTSSPNSQLEIYGSTGGALTDGLRISRNTLQTSQYGVVNYTAGILNLTGVDTGGYGGGRLNSSNGTTTNEILRWTYSGSAGYVSIGNTNTSYNFDVTGTGRFTSTLISSNAGKDGLIVQDTTSQATGVGGSILFKGVYTNGGSPLSFGRISLMKENSANADYSFGMGFYTSANNGNNPSTNPNMYIAGSGNVGIGTTSPSSFSGYTGVTTDGSTGGFYDLFSSGSRRGTFNTTSSLVSIGSTSTTDFALLSNNTERMRITSGGLVGIGTSSPSYLLDIWSTSATLRIRNITAPATGGTSSLLFEGINNYSGVSQSFINSVQAGNSGATQLVFGTSDTTDATATERMRITNTGLFIYGGSSSTNTALFTAKSRTASEIWSFGPNAYNSTNIFRVENSSTTGVYLVSGNTSWTANSDERLKNITGNIENAIDTLKQLRAVKYTWKKDTSNKVNIGLIAQDVIKVLPEIVDIQEDEMNTLGVKYTELVPVLIKAIQEQQAQIEELKAKIK